MKKEACPDGTPLFVSRWDLKDFQAEGEIERAGRFQFVGDFVESFFVVYVEREFPDVDADAGFAANFKQAAKKLLRAFFLFPNGGKKLR